jgi:uncharacterized protein YidB (DUF937 family)
MLDSILKQATQQFGLGDKGGDLMQMILQHVQGQGGLQNFLNGLGQMGLQEKAASWVGTGENAAITAQEAGNVLGDNFLQEAATKLGVSPEAVSGAASQVLPEVVNQATPNGVIPEGLDLAGLAQQFLGNVNLGQGGLGGLLGGLLGGNDKQ